MGVGARGNEAPWLGSDYQADEGIQQPAVSEAAVRAALRTALRTERYRQVRAVAHAARLRNAEQWLWPLCEIDRGVPGPQRRAAGSAGRAQLRSPAVADP